MPDSNADQLKLLMDYTLFHLGLYATLVSAILASAEHFKKVLSLPLWVAVICFVVAGVSGGVIAASIPESATWAAFHSRKLGPWGVELFGYTGWARTEHTFFWLGIFAGIAAYCKAEGKRKA